MCEQELISVKKANAILGRYFGQLSETGYVKPNGVSRLLVVLFVLDMIQYMAPYISGDDYRMIGRFMHSLEGDCLLPYTVYCINRSAYYAYGDDGDDYAGPRT